MYFDVGCLLALALVHGSPTVGFFSHTLYQCLFDYPPNSPLSVSHLTPETRWTLRVSRVSTDPTFWPKRSIFQISNV